MNLVLLSGGSGKRLWPLSNDTRSKQFLKLLDDGHGGKESMVQRVWRQLFTANLSGKALIATRKGQADILKNQLGHDIPLVLEPEKRDTFPAIALSASYLYSNGVDLDEVLTIIPVDPYVDQEFFDKLKEMESVLQNSSCDLGLIGVKPTFPTSKYGYIIPDYSKNDSKYTPVKYFKEKPSESVAESLIEGGALWNCGVFSLKLRYIINLLKEMGVPVEYETLLDHYNDLPQNSFDFEVVEKAENIAVVPYSGNWKDIGTWNTLTDEMATNVLGNGFLREDCINSHIVNELDIPINVMGLSDVIVAASPDGILVSEKHASAKIKEQLKASNIDEQPMYEERRWGNYKVLDYNKYKDGKKVLTKKLKIKASQNISYHTHHMRAEKWTIIDGDGKVVLNGQVSPITEGETINIPIGTPHAIKADTDIELIEVQTGEELTEEDIKRMLIEWKDIVEICKATQYSS